MLLTLKHDGRRAGFIMPAPERLWKVIKKLQLSVCVYFAIVFHTWAVTLTLA